MGVHFAKKIEKKIEEKQEKSSLLSNFAVQKFIP